MLIKGDAGSPKILPMETFTEALSQKETKIA